ncbi:condensation domain-containing protein [Streptomyces sp. NPDC018045]|uniref:condensation domain-containing protein n=1 Tax=Streptomyces sp. NPDC018045 TaxID=3365037 RepID=UPI00378EE63D
MSRARDLTSGEEQFWTFEQLHPEEPLVNVAVCYEIDQPVAPGALLRAAEDVVARHEVLRTSYHAVGGRPAARVHDHAEAELLTAHADCRASAMELVESLALKPFDLTRAPQLRVALVSWREDAHLLLLGAHHVTLDGPSLGVVSDELSDAIAAYTSGRAWEPQPLPVTYSQVAAAERAAASDGSWDAAIAFWRETLAAGGARYPLRTSSGAGGFATHSRTVRLDPDRSGHVRAFAQAQHMSTNIVLMTCWAMLLQRVGGVRELVLGVPVSSRETHDKETLVGLVMNTVPVHVPALDGDPAEALRTVRRRFLFCLRHRHVPLLRLAREVRPGRSLETDPLYQVMFTHNHEAVLSWAGRPAPRAALTAGNSETPLGLAMVEEAGGSIRLEFDVSSQDFDASFADRLTTEYVDLLLGMAGSPTVDVRRAG